MVTDVTSYSLKNSIFYIYSQNKGSLAPNLMWHTIVILVKYFLQDDEMKESDGLVYNYWL